MAEDLDASTSRKTIALIVFSTFWVTATAYNYLRTTRLPPTIPCVGYGKGWIASLRNFFAVTRSKEWLMEGYEKYSKRDELFVLPAVLGMTAEVVIPRSQMGWMLEQPDSVLSTSGAHYELLQGEYAFVKPIILQDPYHEHVVHKNLVRNLNAIVPELEDEVIQNVNELFGMDTSEFKKMDVMESFMRLVPKITNRMVVGQPLCREKGLLDAVLSFTMDVIRTQLVLFLVPKTLHWVIGNLLGLASKYHYWKSSKFTLPLIKQRLQDIEKKNKGHPDYESWKAPNDFVTWSIQTALTEGRTDEADPRRIAMRMLPINFASIHTTSLTAFETMNHILAADPSVLEALRVEAQRILQEEGGWTKQGLARMHRMDSAIRESQRASPIALTFVQRRVSLKNGITTPEGYVLPYGTILSCPWTPVAFDDTIHEDPLKYDAFRYSRPKEAYDAMNADEKGKVDTLKLKQSGLVTTGDRHLPFGHGRHACPGRFFVAHELKIIFAHLLLNYEFKPLANKPKATWVVRFQVPPQVQIEVRRRGEGHDSKIL
ncbi:cytochrome P450 [Dothidotthia symphoricarpi CBS 119687]|uniref:Cytochrome P450 n=1 Tax=Dothidotthia symphoricarpi CBS 119687 TaxID=1392245 RepID=A0A6A6A159_9PLEO|nr:cytochrome P450 [Dothidotthia symphoricarpi CBS 119687]KAF2125560.1 cytochrome P450 [Dothidotthia symphoricarpi CBS 119687]